MMNEKIWIEYEEIKNVEGKVIQHKISYKFAKDSKQSDRQIFTSINTMRMQEGSFEVRH